MAQKTLTTSYLSKLANANHDGVTQQIDDRLQAFETENTMLIQAAAGVHTARQAEDTAYRRFSGKDFASDDLKAADRLEDQYMSAVKNVLGALLYLPESEPMRRKAQQAAQMFKDFQFSTSDGFEAEARKVVNMVQQWQAATGYTIQELGIEPWVTKAHQQALQVLSLVQQRVENESAKVKGELAEARRATDAAIRKAFDIVNALNVIQPSEALTQLIQTLFGIEERAKLYYISSGKTSGDDPKPEPEPEPKPDEGGDDEGGGERLRVGEQSSGMVKPVTPE